MRRLEGHHPVAWAAAEGDFQPLRKILRRSNSPVMLLSSEDFETLLAMPGRAVDFERAAREAGVENIIWAYRLRKPGSYFRSLTSHLSKHRLIVDPDRAASQILTEGIWSVRNPIGSEKNQAPGWIFIFDYKSRFKQFGDAVGGDLRLSKYDKNDRFPGSGILDIPEIPEATLDLMRKVWDASQMRETNTALDESRIRELEAQAYMASGNHVGMEHEDILAMVDARRSQVPGQIREISKRIDECYGDFEEWIE